MTPSDLAVICTISLGTVFIGVLVLSFRRQHIPAPSAPTEEPLALLFDEGILHHATHSALTKFALFPGQSLWEDLHAALKERFPDFPDQTYINQEGSMTLHDGQGGADVSLEMRWRGQLCWVTLHEPENGQDIMLDPILLGELDALRQSFKSSPNAIWQLSEGGEVIWQNRAYRALNREFCGSEDTPLFVVPAGLGPHRISLKKSLTEHTDWYEVTCAKQGKAKIYHAANINALVEAETAQRNFVQTLAKTFAHLSIGLAIFDRNAQLALFNPALIDLTGLPAPFLSARPNMLSFFDQLRENRQMPEPKNYLTWRQEIAEVIAAANDGKYQETWSLENGRTYSVLGRPHPDGATAFLFEDITSEVALTRNFRTELELGQALLDHVGDGVVAFSTSGILTFTNAAYRDIWDQNPEIAFADVTIHDCIALWEAKTIGPIPVQTIETAVMGAQEYDGSEITIALSGGQVFKLDILRVMPGTTAIKFRRELAAEDSAPLHLKTQV